MRIVDAHVHLWDVDAFAIPWFRDGMGLPRISSVAEYRRAAEPCGVEGAVAVQGTTPLLVVIAPVLRVVAHPSTPEQAVRAFAQIIHPVRLTAGADIASDAGAGAARGG